MASLSLGPPVVPFYPFLGEGFSYQSRLQEAGSIILTSLLEDLALALTLDAVREDDSEAELRSAAQTPRRLRGLRAPVEAADGALGQVSGLAFGSISREM